MVYFARGILGYRFPTVIVRLSTEDGELVMRARWQRTALELQRSILFSIRRGRPIWLQDQWGHDVCLRPEAIWGAMVDGR